MSEKISLAAAKAALHKVYGNSVMGSAARIATRDRRVTSGSLMLDMAMGGTVEGGFGLAIGRPHAFWGEKSGGKTTTSKRIAGIFQGMCRNCWRPAKNVKAVPPTKEELAADPDARWSAKGKCDCFAKGLMDHEFIPPPREKKESAKDYAKRVQAFKEELTANSYEETVVAWIDAEHAFEPRYFNLFGDHRRLLLVRPEVGEDAVDIAHVFASSGCIDLMVLDSLAHFTPKDEIEASAHDWQQGLQARIVNKGVRKFISSAHRAHQGGRRLTQIWINQTRMKIGITFGDPTVKPAGMGQDFGAHIEIRFRKSKSEYSDETYGDKSKGEIVSTMVSERFFFEVVKNRSCATKGRKGSYEQTVDGEVLDDGILFKMAMKFLISGESGKGYEFGEYKFKTQKDILEALQGDSKFREGVRTAILARYVPGA